MEFKYIFMYVILFVYIQIFAQTNPVVSNVTFSISGTTVTVNYDVSDPQGGTVTIDMYVSSDAGVTWTYNYGTTTGDIGTSISVGTGKTITWAYSGAYNSNFEIKICANDETADGDACTGTPTVTYSGKIYNTIQIGNQCWLKENLDVGTMIIPTAPGDNQTNNSILEKYCYNNSSANCSTYGGIYQWDEAMQYVTTEGAQGICPTNWHIPTNAELQILLDAVAVSSNALKAIGQGTGNNKSGFSAMLSGAYDGYYGGFGSLGTVTYLWSSSRFDNNYSKMLDVRNNDLTSLSNSRKINGYSVRCLKN